MAVRVVALCPNDSVFTEVHIDVENHLPATLLPADVVSSQITASMVSITEPAQYGQSTISGLTITYQPDSACLWRDTLVCRVSESSSSYLYVRYILHVHPDQDGRQFYVTFLPASIADGYTRKLYIHFAALQEAHVKVQHLSGWTETIDIPEHGIRRYEPNAIFAQCDQYETVENRSLYIEADVPIAVYTSSDHPHSSDASVIMSTTVLSSEYTVQNVPSLKDNMPEFAIVATQDNTEITIIPTVNLRSGAPANVPIQVTLNRGQTYLVQSSSAALTGTRVYSNNKPFALFEGVYRGHIPVGKDAADHIYDQALPLEYLGKIYPVIPMSHDEDYIQVTATISNTNVYRNNVLVATLAQDSTYSTFESTVCTYTSSEPVRVMQYTTGGEWYVEDDEQQGDPSMVALSPYEQAISSTFYYAIETGRIPSKNSFVHLVTSTRSVSNILLDGTPISASEFKALPGSDTLMYVKKQLYGGPHTIECTNGVFWACSYALGRAEAISFMPTQILNIPKDTLVTIADTICNDTSYYFAGCHWTETGIYYDTLYSPNWNDSIVELHLQVNEVQYTDTTDTIVAGTKYVWHSYQLDSVVMDTVLSDTLTSFQRCDSVVTLTLVVVPIIDTVDLDTAVCRKSLPFIWHTYRDVPIYKEGEWRDTLRTEHGFDKTYYILTLSLYENDTTRLQKTICDGQLPYSWEGKTFYAAGEEIVTLQNKHSCDSVLRLHLDVVPQFETETIARVCPNDLPFTWYEHVVNSPGSFVHTFTTAALCDSVVTLSVYMKKQCLDPSIPLNPTVDCDTAYSHTYANIKEKDLPYMWNNQTLPSMPQNPRQDTVLVAPLQKYDQSCDSIATLHLHVLFPCELPTETKPVRWRKEGEW